VPGPISSTSIAHHGPRQADQNCTEQLVVYNQTSFFFNLRNTQSSFGVRTISFHQQSIWSCSSQPKPGTTTWPKLNQAIASHLQTAVFENFKLQTCTENASAK
jgi:hypothetical protein